MLQRYVIGTSMLLACFISGVNCHGFLWNPPGRSVAYKAGYKTPANYDHMGLNCGGFYVSEICLFVSLSMLFLSFVVFSLFRL